MTGKNSSRPKPENIAEFTLSSEEKSSNAVVGVQSDESSPLGTPGSSDSADDHDLSAQLEVQWARFCQASGPVRVSSLAALNPPKRNT